MSGLSISVGRPTMPPPYGSSAADRGTRGRVLSSSDGTVFAPDHLPALPRHGCVVIRRIADDRGREWRVRQLWSGTSNGLLFQCMVPGVRSEVHPMHAPLESLTDDELVLALGPADD
jgi:hypothetical protein